MNEKIQKELLTRSQQITGILLLIAIFLWPIWILFDYFFAPKQALEFLPIRIFFCLFSIVALVLLRKGIIGDVLSQMMFIIPPLGTVSYFFSIVPEEALYPYILGATMVLIVGFFFLILNLKKAILIGAFALLSIVVFQLIINQNSLTLMLANGGFVYISICLFGMAMAVLRYQSTIRSITNEILLEESNTKLQAMVEERGVLLKEIHHRVKNNLQIISSLVKLQEDQLDKKTAKEILQLSQDRIRSLSIVHECLYQAEDFASLNFKMYIEKLTTYLAETYDLDQRKIEILNDVEAIDLELDKMIPCGLIINEAVTNSIKHAFEQKDQGQIKLQAKATNGRLIMIIQDNGSGCDTTTISESENLGIRLIRGLANQLKGDLQLDGGDGFKIALEFDLV